VLSEASAIRLFRRPRGELAVLGGGLIVGLVHLGGGGALLASLL